LLTKSRAIRAWPLARYGAIGERVSPLGASPAGLHDCAVAQAARQLDRARCYPIHLSRNNKENFQRNGLTSPSCAAP
jgi:hypothetical protein